MSVIKVDKVENKNGPKAAFHAYRTGNQTVSGIAQFNLELCDQSNDYDQSTYTFTAPVAGAYLFTGSMLPATTTGNAWHFRRNGVKYGPQIYAINADEVLPATVVAVLAAGETMSMYCDMATGFEASYAYFAGVQL